MKPHLDSHGSGPRWAAPLAVALIWGVNVPVMKAALAFVHPYAFNALRLSLSAVALGLADRQERGRAARGADDVRRASRAPTPWPAVVALGLLTSLAYQVLFIQGIRRTSASHAGLLIASGPLWTAMIARLLGLERIRARAWLGLAVAFVGTSLVATAKGPEGATLLGNAILLAAMVVWGLATVLSRPLLAHIPATRLAFLYTCVALPGHWILALPHLAPVFSGPVAGGSPSGPLGAGGWAAVLYSGLFSTGLAYALWNRSLLRIGPARTSAFVNLVPLVALTVAWAALGERPGALQLAGGALILIGISSWRSARPAARGAAS